MKQILVLGAGIIGLNTAYWLHRQGIQVCVIDRCNDAGMETSYANGAQLSYSYVAPLAGPGVLSKIPKWLIDRNSPLRFKPTLNLADICWSLKFAAACNTQTSAHTTQELLSLSALSCTLFYELLPMLGDVNFSQTGKLVMYRDHHYFEHAKQQLALQRQLGCEQSALNMQECIEKEPALADMTGQMIGGIYTPSEEAADCYKVCQSLKNLLQAEGVQFMFGRHIQALIKGQNNHVRVQLDQNEILAADGIVVALGSHAADLLKPLHINVPIGPLKGYSLTLDIENPSKAPTVSITDFERKIVFARLGNRLRIAGMADRVGLDVSLDQERLNTLSEHAQAVFPAAGQYSQAKQWVGLRPATPKGKPIIDRTKYANLWLNLGHGALGFTLASGSARLLSDLITGAAPSIDAKPFSLSQA